MKQLILSVFLMFLVSSAWGQPWQYNFGTGTGTFTSSTASTLFLPTPISGTSRVRVGTNPGSISLVNPGIGLGTDTELQITSNTSSSSTTKFSVYDYTASKIGYVKFTIAFSDGADGVYNFSLGDGTNFSDNTSIGTSQIFAGIRWTMGATNTITYTVLSASTFGTTGISNTTTMFSQSTSNQYTVEIYANNSTSSTTYFRVDTEYSLPADSWDLWVDGVRVGTALASGNLVNDVNFDSFAFNHQASATTPGTIYLDDIEYSNTLPIATPTVAIASASQITATSQEQNTDNVLLSFFDITITDAAATLESLSVGTSGTYSSEDTKIDGFKLWMDSDATFTGATQIGTSVNSTANGSGETLSFSSLATNLSVGTHYFWVTTDLFSSATIGNTISANAIANTDFTFTSANKSGSVTAGGVITISASVSPVINVSTNSLSAFGNTIADSSSTEQTFTVSGDNLTDAVTVNAPTGFEVSLSTGTGFGSIVNLVQSGGNLTGEPVTVYVRFSPASANGSNSDNITVVSDKPEFTTENVSVSGFAYDTAPTTASSSLSFDTIAETSLEFSWTRGDGDSVLVIMKSGLSPVDFDPSDLTAYSANSAFGSSTELGTGNYAVYSGVGTTVTVTGLSAATTYQVEVFEFNVGSAELTHNYNVGSTLIGSQLTNSPTEGLQISSTNTNFVIDFESTVSNVNNGAFTAAGFSSSPSNGQLNSNAWSITGMSDGNVIFGGTGTTGDNARGTSTGGVSTGGVYAFDTGSNTILGFQPGGSDFTPGTLVLKVQNQSGETLDRINFSYTLWVKNDQGYSSLITPEFSTDNSSYNSIENTSYTTVAVADGSPAWVSVTFQATIYSVNISNGTFFYIRWSSDDASGSGSRDEFGFDDITFNVNSTTNYRTVSGTAGWRMLSSPISGFTIADISDNTAIQGVAGGANAAADSNFYTYTSEGAWNTPSTVSTAIADGYGYIVYFYNNELQGSSLLPITLDVNGSEAGSDVDVALNTTTAILGSHFTLVGNPFASNLNTNSITATGGTIQANIQFWNNATSAYVIQDRTGPFIVAPWSGFWVESTDGAASISIPTSGKTASASGTSYFAKEAAHSLSDLKFELESSYNTDAAIQVQFRDEATFGWDLWDASKFTSLNANFALLGFQAEAGRNLKAVESLPTNLSEVVEIPMEVLLSGSTQEVNLSWNSLASFPEEWTFTLNDSETNSSINLREVESYAFVIQGSPAKASGHAQKNPIVSASGNARFTLLINPGTSTTSIDTQNGIPSQLELSQNYPNPFNPSTQIQFALPAQSNVRLSVFDMLGREVAILVNGNKHAGKFTINFDGSTLSSGMYMYRLVSNGSSITKKLTLIK